MNAVKLDVPISAPSGAAPSPKNVAEAARQFEALLIAQLLKSARGDQAGWLGTGEEEGGAMAGELAEEQFAQALAQRGGLGLSAQIMANLNHPNGNSETPTVHGVPRFVRHG